MKKILMTTALSFLLVLGNMVTAKDYPEEYLGLPGDNLNLYAVLDIFQKSKTLEAFEREINNPDAMINNLDLNGDNFVDYIMVYDYVYDNIHNIVLRVALNENEQQDVAVFVVEKLRGNKVQIQLIGDEALYGPDYIIEPAYAERPNPGYVGEVTVHRNPNVVYTTYYDVATWPVIVYISRPVYRPWRSVWYWGYYPTYWSAWSPHYWHYYYGYHYHWHTHYYVHYRPARRYRCNHYHNVYQVNVRQESREVVNRVRSGDYRGTYSRPEKRDDGEKLFAQRHPDRYETAVNTTGRGVSGRHNNGSSAVTGQQRSTGNRAPEKGISTRGDRRGQESVDGRRNTRINPSERSGRQVRTPVRSDNRNESVRNTNRTQRPAGEQRQVRRPVENKRPERSYTTPSRDRQQRQSVERHTPSRRSEVEQRPSSNRERVRTPQRSVNRSSAPRRNQETRPAQSRPNRSYSTPSRSSREESKARPASRQRSSSNVRQSSSRSRSTVAPERRSRRSESVRQKSSRENNNKRRER